MSVLMGDRGAYGYVGNAAEKEHTDGGQVARLLQTFHVLRNHLGSCAKNRSRVEAETGKNLHF